MVRQKVSGKCNNNVYPYYVLDLREDGNNGG